MLHAGSRVRKGTYSGAGGWHRRGFYSLALIDQLAASAPLSVFSSKPCIYWLRVEALQIYIWITGRTCHTERRPPVNLDQDGGLFKHEANDCRWYGPHTPVSDTPQSNSLYDIVALFIASQVRFLIRIFRVQFVAYPQTQGSFVLHRTSKQ